MPTPTPNGYENAPATKMLATNCAVCARALVDSVSVEAGIGPDCRKKHGYNIEVDDVLRQRANKLVHTIATTQRGVVAIDATRQLRDLGFTVLAARIATRLFEVVMTRTNGLLTVSGPYTERAAAAFRSVPGRRWNNDDKRNEAPESAKPALWAAMKKAYPGYNCIGPDGNFFAIPSN